MSQPLDDWTAAQAEPWQADTRRAKARNLAIDAALSAAKRKAKGAAADIEALDRSVAVLRMRNGTSPSPLRLALGDHPVAPAAPLRVTTPSRRVPCGDGRTLS